MPVCQVCAEAQRMKRPFLGVMGGWRGLLPCRGMTLTSLRVSAQPPCLQAASWLWWGCFASARGPSLLFKGCIRLCVAPAGSQDLSVSPAELLRKAPCPVAAG